MVVGALGERTLHTGVVPSGTHGTVVGGWAVRPKRGLVGVPNPELEAEEPLVPR